MKGALLDRALRAYRPLCLRGTLVEGTYRLPRPRQAERRRMRLLALVAAVLHGRRP